MRQGTRRRIAWLLALASAACVPTPDLVFVDPDAARPDSSPLDDGSADAADAADARDAAGPGAWVNTCPSAVPPGATTCNGATACLEQRPGDCANAASDCTQCGDKKLCCVDNGGNVSCRTAPDKCP
jgi:hypothetical protein